MCNMGDIMMLLSDIYKLKINDIVVLSAIIDVIYWPVPFSNELRNYYKNVISRYVIQNSVTRILVLQASKTPKSQ